MLFPSFCFAFFVRPSWIFWKEILVDKVASLEVPTRARPDTFEISSDHRVSSQRAPKQVINVDNVYRTSTLLQSSKLALQWWKRIRNLDPSLQDPTEARGLSIFWLQWSSYQHDRWDAPEGHAFVGSSIAKKVQHASVSCEGFLKKLAQRHPPPRHTKCSSLSWPQSFCDVQRVLGKKRVLGKNGLDIHVHLGLSTASRDHFMHEWLKLQHVAGSRVRTEQTQRLAPAYQTACI